MPTFDQTSHCANKASGSKPKSYAGHVFDKPLALIALFIVFPVLCLNSAIALFKHENVFRRSFKVDALGRRVQLSEFRFGFLKNVAQLLDIFTGKLGFCGIPLTHTLSVEQQQNLLNMYIARPGIFSAFDIHRLVGLAGQDNYKLLTRQLESSHLNYLTLLVKGVFCHTFYSHSYSQSARTSRCPSVVTLFGIGINNTTMKNAVSWIVSGKKFKGIETKPMKPGTPRTGFFINANSINECAKTPSLTKLLKKADCLFPDGSGLRIAARYQNLTLKDNLNGTDMLPILCAQAAMHNKSIFLLGAKPDVAKKAAFNLIKKHRGLNIAGYHHGYFSPAQNENIVALINRSQADIVLVAQGTPTQEQWICDHSTQLKCEAILGVGGLFDYFSGNIPRAPLWMRELGLEWVWRLMQEPVTKFKRYVIGTPEFLYRTFVLNQVNKGV